MRAQVTMQLNKHNGTKQLPYLKEIIDPLDSDGNVHVPQKPGLGVEIDFDYIEANAI